MGRSLTERPDLFAGVLDLVPAANTLRAEFTAGGPANIPEFGSITTAFLGSASLNLKASLSLSIMPGLAFW